MSSPGEQIARIAADMVVCPTKLERHPKTRHGIADEVAGVYFLWTADHGLLYIGSSWGILYRIVQHNWSGRVPFAMFSILEVPETVEGFLVREHIESAYIRALEPEYNSKTYSRRFPGVDDFERRIRETWEAQLFNPAEEAHDAQV